MAGIPGVATEVVNEAEEVGGIVEAEVVDEVDEVGGMAGVV